MKLGIYCRVSSSQQKSDGESLETQEYLGIDFCKLNSFKYEVFKEAKSGVLNRRKELDKLFSKLRSKELDGIWIKDYDRFNRGEEKLKIELAEVLIETKCSLYERDSKRDILKVYSDMIGYESKMFTSKLQRLSILNNSADGILRNLNSKVLGQTKFGYKKRKGIVSVNEEEKDILVDIYKVFNHANVKDFKSFKIRMNKKHGLSFSDLQYKRYLTYKGYCGEIEQKYTHPISKEVHFGKVNVPILIEEELFNITQLKVKDFENRRKGRVKNEYLLRGKVFCLDCNAKMYKIGSQSKKNNLNHFYYKCSNSLDKKNYVDSRSSSKWDELNSKCNSYKLNSINFSLIDECVWEFLFDFLLDSKTIELEYKKKYEGEVERKNRYKGKLKYYEGELEKLDKNEVDLFFKNSNDEINDRIFQNTLSQINTKRKKIENDISMLGEMKNDFNKNTLIIDYLKLMEEDIRSDYELVRFEDKKRILDKYISKVFVKRNIDLNYSLNISFKFDFLLEDLENFGNKNYNLQNKDLYIKVLNL
jgi:site-specific DNA recombinase